jgi:probable HAF family extracellular repeat protein
LNWAGAVNEAGQIVGGVSGGLAISTPGNGVEELGTLGGGKARLVNSNSYGNYRSLNEEGQVVGVSTTASGDEHAFSWTHTDGMVDLGTLGGSSSEAVAVNGTGLIVGTSKTASGGTHATLWQVHLAPPPTITTTVTGTLGLNSWYTSNVAIVWSVSGAESVSGCEQAIVTADTPGATFTCTATSPGGTTTASVTIKRDATPPTLACTASPNTLWPPNHKLVPVTTSVTVEDALSGPAGFNLVSATSSESDPASDAQGWTLGDPDTSGLLRAERSGGLGDRTYTLAYQGSDAAGKSANCNLAVTVRSAPASGTPR